MSRIVSPLYPANDLQRTAKFEILDPLTLKQSFIETGTATAFFATSDLSDAVKADDALEVAVTHVKDGKWLVKFQSAVLTPALLRTTFSEADPPKDPVLICVHSSGARCVAYFEVVEAREFTLRG